MRYNAAWAAWAFIAPALSVSAQTAAPAMPTRPPVYPYGTSINLLQIKAIVAAAEVQARQIGAHVAIAVSDADGNLIYFENFDETSIGMREIAIAKARFSARFRMPTSYVADMLHAGNDGLTHLPGAVAGGGGIPLVLDGKTVGAIGVSGSMLPAKDMAIAGAGAAALK